MKWILLFSFLGTVLPWWTSPVQDNLTRVKLSDHISVSLPKDFMPMSEADIQRRHLSYRRPVAMYTEGSGQVDFGFNASHNDNWSVKDLPILQSFYESTIRSMYTDVEFLRRDQTEINGKPFVVFEFVSTVTEEGRAPIRKYTYIQYTIRKSYTLVFHFTCPAEQQTRWQPTAVAIMQSVKVEG
ncbi:hypothetical protein SAMN05421823_103243 [Catalinimonas alkaloidigena]|uniref:Uncharacterized protein n=1 Tax=Catalinimonas alkaloidigena TaxID=1075417 RepID=A0A1G9DTG8_9BACT|nr:hypothetical protein [Catalinimonas alkaloidigena]SDK67149.1 hypothetical protein SAMN05421823_103243 [Catalinimonas alkaloidigena]